MIAFILCTRVHGHVALRGSVDSSAPVGQWIACSPCSVSFIVEIRHGFLVGDLPEPLGTLSEYAEMWRALDGDDGTGIGLEFLDYVK